MGIYKVYGHNKGEKREHLVAAYVHAKTPKLAKKYTRKDHSTQTITRAVLM